MNTLNSPKLLQNHANSAKKKKPLRRSTKVHDKPYKRIEKLTWACICLCLAPLFSIQFQEKSSSIPKELMGYSLESLANGLFQEYYENELLQKPIIHNLRKYKNEYEYRFFNKINVDKSYIGKDGYIYDENMTQAYFGDDYNGEKEIQEQVRKAKFVQDKLKDYGIELLILFAPGKNSIYPEYLPDNILQTQKKTRNYQTYRKECQHQNVNYIDFVEYFQLLKPSLQYPLFPQFGSHWSYFAECLVVDTTIKRLEKLMNADLPNIVFNDIQLLDTALVRDADILSKASISIPKGKPLAYPSNITYSGTTEATPKKVLGIGDSFYRCFLYLGAMQYAFHDSQQWYYYNSIIPEKPNNPEVWELDLKKSILEQNAIVILCNEANLKTLGNGFIDDAYLLFSHPNQYYQRYKNLSAINRHKKEIRENKSLLLSLRKKALYKGITLDSLITEFATTQ